MAHLHIPPRVNTKKVLFEHCFLQKPKRLTPYSLSVVTIMYPHFLHLDESKAKEQCLFQST